MQVYNTLSKKKEEFVPINPPNVTFYMCGPTVYDFFHIGNGRSFIMSDVIRRYLTYKGYKVKFVMNLTDIDDRIIKRANDEKTDSKEIANKYIKAFYEDVTKLGIKKADIYPKATEHINEILTMIETLVEKGFAYNVNGDVFFDVSSFPEYGKLSGKKIEELESGARVEINENKKNPLDFSLWKKAKEGEPAWKSPWGLGRPGWHIECSAMSTAHLGETIDIHAGGSDLIFPHHENEIAQSEAAIGKQFVKYWLHLGFLNIREEKMSKSLGNFLTTREMIAKYNKNAIRLFFLQAHYRGPLNYSEELLNAAEKGWEKIQNFVDELKARLNKDASGAITPDFDLDAYRERFEAAMDDDFNSPQALAVIYDFIRDVNKIFASSEKLSADFLNSVKEFLRSTAVEVLGVIDFEATKIENESMTDDLIKLLINIRNDARKDKNFSLADKIRNELEKIGITLKDSKDGTTYKIV